MNVRKIPFSGRHFERSKYPPLTAKLILALIAAVDQQKKPTQLGLARLSGSLTTLISRDLLVRKKSSGTNYLTYQWQVTKKAIDLLQSLGCRC